MSSFNQKSLFTKTNISTSIKFIGKIFDTPLKLNQDSVLNSERTKKKSDISIKLNNGISNGQTKKPEKKILFNKKKIMSTFASIINIDANKSRNTLKVKSFEVKSAENQSSNKVASGLSSQNKVKNEKKAEEIPEGKKTISFNFFHKISLPNKSNMVLESIFWWYLDGKRYESVRNIDLRKKLIFEEKSVQNSDFSSFRNGKRDNLSKERAKNLFNSKFKEKAFEKPFQNKTVLLNISKIKAKLNK